MRNSVKERLGVSPRCGTRTPIKEEPEEILKVLTQPKSAKTNRSKLERDLHNKFRSLDHSPSRNDLKSSTFR